MRLCRSIPTDLPRAPRRIVLGWRRAGALFAACALLPRALFGVEDAAPAGTVARTFALVPTVNLTAEAWYNTLEDATPSSNWISLLELAVAAEFDAAQPGRRTLFCKGAWLANSHDARSIDTGAGTFNPMSNIAAYRHTRIRDLSYRHIFAANDAQLKLGLIAIDDDFMLSEHAGHFINSAFGAMPSQVATPIHTAGGGSAGYALYPVSTPGARWSFAPKPSLTWQTGVYYGGPGADVSSNHGFDREAWSEARAVLFTELAWSPAKQSAVTFSLGGSYHAADHRHFAVGDPAAGSATVGSLWNLYTMADFALVRSSAGATQLGGFLRFGGSPQQDRAAVTTYADAGLVFYGPLAQRPNDVAGVALAMTTFSSGYARANELRGTETAIELTYKFAAGTHVVVQLDAQWVSPAGLPAGRTQHAHSVVFGARALLSF